MMREKKRLLLLGGENIIQLISKFAMDNDVSLLATSSRMSIDVKNSVKERYTVSTTDTDGVRELIISRGIDGVYLGANEDIISANIATINNLGLPCYATDKVWDITSNKRLFKAECRKIGLPVADDYDADTISASMLPVVVKPIDSCGSQGVYLCKAIDDYRIAVSRATAISKSSSILVEEYLEGEEISVHYTVKDGKAKLSSMSDKYESTHCRDFNPISDAYAYPSKRIHEYLAKYDEKMKKLFRNIGIRNGIVFVQGYYHDGDFKFFEMGHRIPGTLTFRYTDAVNNISALDLILKQAAGIDYSDYALEKENALFNKYCTTITMLSRPGVVAEIHGVESIREIPEVISVDLHYNVGDEIMESQSLSQTAVWVFICANMEERLKRVIREVQDTLSFIDTDGNMMLFADFDVNRLTFYLRHA